MDGIQQTNPKPCVANCGFFGNATTEDMCSKCYRDKQQQQTVAGSVDSTTSSILSSSPPRTPVGLGIEEQVDPTRCYSCSRKVGLTGIKCRCSFIYCGKHRHAFQHDCPFDYKEKGREILAKSNPVVMTSKLDKI